MEILKAHHYAIYQVQNKGYLSTKYLKAKIHLYTRGNVKGFMNCMGLELNTHLLIHKDKNATLLILVSSDSLNSKI